MTSFSRAAILLAGLSIASAVTPAFAAGSGQCLIDDPTGTPLNVRTAPNGTILTTLPNGTRIDVIDEMKIGAKRWFFAASGSAGSSAPMSSASRTATFARRLRASRRSGASRGKRAFTTALPFAEGMVYRHRQQCGAIVLLAFAAIAGRHPGFWRP